jgi:dihydrofolate reductase
MDEKGGIGLENRLPWRLSADLKRFKALTMGHHLIMGRKTYESIGKALSGRQMIVISRNPDFNAPGARVVTSLEDAMQIAHQAGETEIFIAGGSQIFALALPLADRIYLTRVHAITRADTFCPEINWADWTLASQEDHSADEKNEFPSTFLIFDKHPTK